MRSRGSEWGSPWWAGSAVEDGATSQLCLGAEDAHSRHWGVPTLHAGPGPGEPVLPLGHFLIPAFLLLACHLVHLWPLGAPVQLMTMLVPSISDLGYRGPCQTRAVLLTLGMKSEAQLSTLSLWQGPGQVSYHLRSQGPCRELGVQKTLLWQPSLTVVSVPCCACPGSPASASDLAHLINLSGLLAQPEHLFSTVNCLALLMAGRVDSLWAGKPVTCQSAGNLCPGSHTARTTALVGILILACHLPGVVCLALLGTSRTLAFHLLSTWWEAN